MGQELDIDVPGVQIKGKAMKKILSSIIFLIFVVLTCFLSGISTGSLPRFDQPILITSAGQSADVQIGGVLIKRAGLVATLSKNATRLDLGENKTLMLVIGVSMKGLGAAGLDLEQEKTRVSELIKEADRMDIPLICLHLGGEARRGDLSDQMIKTFLPHSQMAIVVKSGNKDGLFTEICTENNIPLHEVERINEVQEYLKSIFSKNE
jgi:hypothetical protein